MTGNSISSRDWTPCVENDIQNKAHNKLNHGILSFSHLQIVRHTQENGRNRSVKHQLSPTNYYNNNHSHLV